MLDVDPIIELMKNWKSDEHDNELDDHERIMLRILVAKHIESIQSENIYTAWNKILDKLAVTK